MVFWEAKGCISESKLMSKRPKNVVKKPGEEV
jgi:hypothetical protein